MDLKFASGVCIVNNDKTLLLKERESGNWGMPAGHSEEGEDLIQTAVRETKEETNLNIKVTHLIQATFIRKGKKNSYIACFYLGEILGSSKIDVQDEEVTEYVWATKDDIKNDKYILRDKLLKKILLKALDNDTSNLDTFEVLKTEDYK